MDGSLNCTGKYVMNTTSMCNNTTDPMSEPEEKNTVQPLFLLGCALIVLTVVGNALVILAFSKEATLRTLTNYWIISLSCTDLVLAFLVMPIFITDEIYRGVWQFSDLFCHIFISLDVLCCTCSIYHLGLISLDRYLCVQYPVRYPKSRTARSTLIAICITWMACIVIGMAHLVGWRDQTHTPIKECRLSNKSFKIFSSLVSFYIPLILIMTLYCRIASITRRQARKMVKRAAKISYDKVRKKLSITTRSACPLPQDHSSLPIEPVEHTHSVESNPNMDDTPNNNVPYTKASAPMFDRIDVLPVESNTSLKRTQSVNLRTPTLSPSNSTFVLRSLTSKLSTARRHEHHAKTRLERSKQRQEQRAAKIVVIILSVFVAFWSPFFAVNIYDAICDQENNCVSEFVWHLVSWLGYANSAINPFIYTYFNITFRHTIARLLGCARQAAQPGDSRARTYNALHRRV